MSKEQQIQAWKKLNEHVNNVEIYIKGSLMQAMQGDAFLVDLAQRALREYHPGGMDTKDYTDRAIAYINKPDVPSYEIIKGFGWGGLGIFNDVRDHAWDPRDEEKVFERIEAVLEKFFSYGGGDVTFFADLSTGRKEHEHLNFKSPWEWDLKNRPIIDFNTPCDRYWHLYKRFLGIIAKYGRRACPIGEMARYTEWPYQKGNNKQGYENFQDGLRTHKWKAWRLVVEQIRLGMDPLYLPINEYNHDGQCAKAHWIAWWHKQIWDHLVSKGLMTDLRDFHIDISLSDFCRSDLVYHGNGMECRDCGRKWTPPPTDRCPITYVNGVKVGCGSENVWQRGYCVKCRTHKWVNDPKFGRKALPIHHDVNIKDDLERGHISLKGFKGSANERFNGGGDGGSNPKSKIVPVPGLKWRIGDPQQTHEMVEFATRECLSVGKEFSWDIYPIEVVELMPDDQQIALYSVDRINWDRFDAARRGFLDGAK